MMDYLRLLQLNFPDAIVTAHKISGIHNNESIKYEREDILKK